MQVHKKKIKKEDGRYLIYYTFTEEGKEARDVRVEMESHPETMDNSSYSSAEQDI